jgi:sulfate/thiosulfate transport system ATP-binding protein
MTIRVEGIFKRFGANNPVAAANGVSFIAPAHGITSLLGPSGSGKSTLLRLAAGLEVPDAGKIWINDVDVTNVPARERGVGLVFQNYALFQHMSVFENVAFGLTIRKAPKSEVRARVEELLELVQLKEYGRRLPSELSGGQRQRIALARAMAIKPSVLLLDEPFGALDTRVRVELRDWLHRLHAETGVTTLLVTHDQEEALELSTHIVLLRDGKVEQAGSPSELYEHPKSAFVASFLGGAKVLHGSVRGGRAEFAQRAISTAAGLLREGEEVEGFLRPHDVQIRKVAADVPAGDAGIRVERLAYVGAFVKLTLVLPDGDKLNVQVPRHEFVANRVEEGDSVMLGVRELRLSPSNPPPPPVDFVN